MEVKSIYLDLQKAEIEKRGKKTVWKLESEAFQEPLKLEIWYSDEDKEYFEQVKQWIEEQMETMVSWLAIVDQKREELERLIYSLKDRLSESENLNTRLTKELIWKEWEINALYKEIASVKTMNETLSGTILHLQDQTSLISKNLTKQPTIIHDKMFISWHENTWLNMVNLYDGDYLMIMNVKIWEHNEFVTNQNELITERIHVEGQTYIPFYKLEWWTELDKPTATIYYDLIFIPC